MSNDEPPCEHAYFLDEPLSEIGPTDDLDRARVVVRLVRVLDRLRPQVGSVVVGLVAPWGAGKTTVLNALSKQLPQWEVRRLDTWLASDAGELATQLYTTIYGALPTDRRWRRVRAQARTVFTAATPAVLSLAHPAAGQAAEGLLKRYGADPSLTQQHAALSKELAKLERPILVLIDDVDRLQPVELRELLRALRVVGRLPRVSYVLAYDERSLLDSLTVGSLAPDHARARDFIDKIVQVRIDVPPLLPDQARSLILQAIHRIGESTPLALTKPQFSTLDYRWEATLKDWITTPRHVKLLEGQLLATWPDVAGEVDFIDFMSITAFRLFQPGLYLRLQEDRHILTGRGDLLGALRWARTTNDALLGEVRANIMNEAPRHLRDGLEVILDSMFPQPPGRGLATPNGIGSPAYVDRYFYTGIPSDDFSDAKIDDALRAIIRGGDSDARRSVESQLANESVQRSILSKLSAQSSDASAVDSAALLRWLLEVAVETIDADARLLGAWAERLFRQQDLSREELAALLRRVPDKAIDLVVLVMTSDLGSDAARLSLPQEGPYATATEVAAKETLARLKLIFQTPAPDADTPLLIRTGLGFLSLFQPTMLLEALNELDQPGGWDSLDLAARYVTRTSTDGSTWHARDFEPREFEQEIPAAFVSRAQAIAKAIPTPIIVEGDDPAHRNLRAIAAAALAAS